MIRVEIVCDGCGKREPVSESPDRAKPWAARNRLKVEDGWLVSSSAGSKEAALLAGGKDYCAPCAEILRSKGG